MRSHILLRYAKQVWAIESDPAWSWTFTKYLYRVKPANLTWILGNAESVADFFSADVAVVRTRSGAQKMVALAERMAEMIILSVCEEPLIVQRGDQTLRHITQYIDRRVEELKAQAMAAYPARIGG